MAAPETELNFKFYRQATNKIVGISSDAAAFLRGFSRELQNAQQGARANAGTFTPRATHKARQSCRGSSLTLGIILDRCPCIRELFSLRPVYEKYHKSGFEIVGIYCDKGSASELRTFLDKYGMVWPQRFGGAPSDPASLAQRFGIAELPTTFLIDRDGKVIGRNVRGAALEPALRRALGLSVGSATDAMP